ncbi:MAG: hypothetical protein HOE90_18210 [Bacteriovoracaceae bacterium]|nr:hypothetical protein [Bacteriovoracaceae bacterium]
MSKKECSSCGSIAQRADVDKSNQAQVSALSYIGNGNVPGSEIKKCSTCNNYFHYYYAEGFEYGDFGGIGEDEDEESISRLTPDQAFELMMSTPELYTNQVLQKEFEVLCEHKRKTRIFDINSLGDELKNSDDLPTRSKAACTIGLMAPKLSELIPLLLDCYKNEEVPHIKFFMAWALSRMDSELDSYRSDIEKFCNENDISDGKRFFEHILSKFN